MYCVTVACLVLVGPVVGLVLGEQGALVLGEGGGCHGPQEDLAGVVW